MQKTYNVTVDLKRKSYYSAPEMRYNDNNVLQLEVLSDGVAFDLFNVTTVSLVVKRPDQQVILLAGTKNNNVATFTLNGNELAIAGRCEATAQFYDANGRVSTVDFTIVAVADPTANGYTPSTNEQTLIETVLNDGPLRIQEAINATNAANTAATNATNVANAIVTTWKTPVANYAAIATTYPSPSRGDTVQTLDDGKVYRYSGSTWAYTQGYSATAIADVNNKLTQLETNVTTHLGDIVTTPTANKILKLGNNAKYPRLVDSSKDVINATSASNTNHTINFTIPFANISIDSTRAGALIHVNLYCNEDIFQMYSAVIVLTKSDNIQAINVLKTAQRGVIFTSVNFSVANNILTATATISVVRTVVAQAQVTYI